MVMHLAFLPEMQFLTVKIRFFLDFTGFAIDWKYKKSQNTDKKTRQKCGVLVKVEKTIKMPENWNKNDSQNTSFCQKNKRRTPRETVEARGEFE